MNNVLSIGIFLDILILLVNIRDDETLQLLDELINAYTDELKYNKSVDRVIVTRFLGLLKELKKFPRGEEGDANRITTITNYIINSKDIELENKLFFDSLKNLFDTAKSIRQNDNELKLKKKKIRNVLTFTNFKRLTTRMYGELNNFSACTDLEQQDIHLATAVNMARKIIESVSDNIEALGSSAEERVIFSDKESISNALEKAIAAEESGMVLQSDLQGLNQMLGKRGGFVRGEFVVIHGLSHHFKTGLLLTIARGLASRNDPSKFVKKGKKPLILFVTLENYANRNALWFYKTAYACTFGKRPDMKASIAEIAEIVQQFYTKNGWEFIIERYKGINFGYDEYVALIEKYEALGYDVVISLVDYMEKMKKTSSMYQSNNTDGAQGTGLATLCQCLFDYNKSKEILFITPNQFNRKMQEVADRVKTNVVKHFSTDGVGGSIAINQIADLEIYVYIETDMDKHSWLTVMRGKHRYVDDTPVAARYFAYSFDDELGIVADVDGKKKFVRDIYAVSADNTDDKKKKKDGGNENSVQSYTEVELDDNF